MREWTRRFPQWEISTRCLRISWSPLTTGPWAISISPMKAGGEFCRYCGTPLACSVSEAGQEKSIVQVELGEKGDRKVRLLP